MGGQLNPFRRVGIAVGIVSAALLPACSVGGSKSMAKANDDLRRRVIALEDEKKALEQTNAELLAKVAELSKDRGQALPQDVLAAMPRSTSISVSGIGTWLDPSDTSRPAASVHVSVSVLDGRGRSMQGVGTLRIEVLVLPDGATIINESGERSPRSGATPLRTVRAELGPTALREAYREGLFGASYAVDLPLESPLPERKAVAIVRASFADAVTGLTHEATKLVDVH